ncbi:MAG TPA: tRNA (adenosine(37)-N6)-dimethylallyltransferase MiaA [Candidatus Acidoferrales bacterium]|nr:tRNA (adenosine(37)-N6)-dimethylallyltransferase MiaA [Candidatus Acidoferrales bacterium]
MNLPRKLVVILGPTASGKSALAIALAGKLNGEIVCCDSTQVYRYFDIGTGKTTAAEQKGIRHHLMNIAEPDQVFTAGDYRRKARHSLEEISARGKLPILTVGTGLYLRALLEGLDDLPARSEKIRQRLRERVQQKGPEYLHRILARRDTVGAARIASRDTQKVIRAIEVSLLTGKPASQLLGRGRDALQGFTVIKIGLLPARAKLYARIDRRVEEMLAAGWTDEVGSILRSGISPSVKAFTFIGYSQIREHIVNGVPLEPVIPEIQQATRRYAKRQLTWFRRESNVHWLTGFGTEENVQAEALQIIVAG